MKKLFVLALLLMLSGRAAAEYFDILTHDVNIDVRRSAVMDITEKITVKFRSPRHGIYTFMPYIYKQGIIKGTAERPTLFGGKYKILVYDIDTPGNEAKISRENGNLKIRLGDPDRLVSGVQEYTIKYSVFGAVNFFPSSSEVYWNVHGNYWDATADHVNFTINLPAFTDINDDDIFVYTGRYGSVDTDAQYSFDGKTLTGHTTKSLGFREGVSVGMRLPEGFLKYGSSWLRFRLFAANNLTFVVPVLYVLFLFVLWWKIGRNEGSPVMVFYEPPAGVSPAVAGVVIDDDLDNRDLVSVFLKWAADKIIRIEEVEDPGSILGRSDYLFVKLRELPVDAPDYEDTLFDGMFPAEMKNRRLSEMKNNYYITMKTAKEQLNSAIDDMSIYKSGSRALSTLMKGGSIGFVILGFGLFIMTDNAGWLASSVVMAGATFFFGRIITKRTAAGQSIYQKIAGFKEFIERAEKDKLERMLKKYPEYFSMTVPYALAFGHLKDWGEKFEGLMSEPPDWYVSRNRGGAFSAYAFASALNSTASSMGRTMVSQPAPEGGAGGGSSGFGGGGGFSGGGFGGGGGGSW
jgi:uncharacterized membrane protein YgcG